MSQFFQIHPQNPQLRLIRKAVEMVREGAVIVYPTDSAYALGCHIGDKQALERIIRIRRLDNKHNFTLVCRDLSEISIYAKVSNTAYRLVNAFTPGPYTFILPATRDVPRRLLHPKKRTIGLRVPQHAITRALLDELNEPLMSTTLIFPDENQPMNDAYEIRERLEHVVDLVIDGGHCQAQPTTVVDMTGELPRVTRYGQGDPTPFDAEQRYG